MRRFVATLSFIFAACCTPALAQPSIAVAPSSIELGTIGAQIVDTTITITNTGSAPLVLERASVPCGCTAARFERNTLAPGESTTLAVTLDSRGKNGDMRSSVTIHSNDARNASVFVPLHATVVRDADQTPVTARP